MTVQRGSVWFVDLPGVGDKPVVVVSWQPIQETLSAAIVARITSVERRRTLPTVARIEDGEGGLDRGGYVLCHDLSTASMSDFRRHVGQLSAPRMAEVDAALRRALDLGER